MADSGTEMEPRLGSVRSLAHAGVTVRDMDRSLEFYCGMLGLEVESDVVIEHPYLRDITAVAGTGIRVVFLRVADTDARVEVLEYQGVERHPGSARPCDPGTGHFSLFVDDVAAIHQRLLANGYSTRSPMPVEAAVGPRAGTKIIYSIDPDGYHIELMQRPGSV